MLMLCALLALSAATPCPSPLSRGPWLGGSCALLQGTPLADQTGPVILNLNGTTLDCQGRPGIVWNVSESILLSHGAMINCRSGNSGGALNLGGAGDATLNDMAFTNCSSPSWYGGAVAVGNAVALRLIHSRFELCFAASAGAIAIGIDNSPITTSLTASNCTFTNCESSGWAGAIFITGGARMSVLDTCTFEGNRCVLQGGSIRTDSPLLIRNSNFQDCGPPSSLPFGTAIQHLAGGMNISCTSFQNCSYAIDSFGAPQPRIDQCNFANTSPISGGQLYVQNWWSDATALPSQLFQNAISIVSRSAVPIQCVQLPQVSASQAQETFTPSTSSITSAHPQESAIAIYWVDHIIDTQIALDSPLFINSLTILLPGALDGALITAPSIHLSGTLTIDLSSYQGFDGSILLFDGALEGEFSDLIVLGVDCTSVSLEQGELFVINTCSSASSGLFVC